ncbi:MAG TPA: tetratricopeptide repeat protein [Hyphomicrobiaceae bacterium]|nr:tetratricopeptide repeat protein [Hyphomicrobiaceae bacterium]
MQRFAHWSGTIGVLVGMLAGSATWAAAAQPPAGNAEPLQSYLGSYLAGRVARGLNDTESAVTFYRHALAQDSANPRILERAFLMELTEGNASQATTIARRLIKFDGSHRLAHLWLGVASFKTGDYRSADKYFARSNSGPIGELTSALARAWTAMGQKRHSAAVKHLQFRRQADWAKFYLQFHGALIADLSGRKPAARQAFQALFETDPRTPRTTMAVTRHASHWRDFAFADTIFARNIANTGGQAHPAVEDLRIKNVARERLAFLAPTPRDGLAEVFYGLGDALTTEGGLSLGAIYLQMAIHLKPDFPFALAALANVFETTKQHDRAIATYDRIRANSALKPLIDIRRATNLNATGKADEAEKVLKALLGERSANNAGKTDAPMPPAPSPALLDLRAAEIPGRIMRLGERGTHVGQLHGTLTALGIDAGEKTETFGEPLADAIRTFQRQQKLRTDGIFGGATRRQLQSALTAAIQSEEARLGITPGKRSPPTPLPLQEASELKIYEALASMLRQRQKYPEAIIYYSRIIARLPKPEKRHWGYWYARGTSYERAKDWPNAEKDLLKALELNSDQPLILNYLGYSWVDQNKNLARGLELITRAVQLKPDDGYIVDSLGWAYFRLGRYPDAVKHLERAVELRPNDPILNDHLGDAMWRVGRRREARYQWELSLTLKPEAAAMELTKKKLLVGLPEEASNRAIGLPKTDEKPKSIGKRADTAVRPQSPPVIGR